METTREWLRALPALAGTAPRFEVGAAFGSPVEQFVAWIRDAVARGVSEPHVATLATVGSDGMPDARTLILKDVSESGWAIAGRRSSAKGAQLAAEPTAALTFWWQPIARAVRVRGPVVEASRVESDADLAARSPAARAGVSEGDWVLWRIEPSRVEFWQGSPDRNHIRLVYSRSGDAWTREALTAD